MAAKFKEYFETGTPFVVGRVRRDDSKFENRTRRKRKWRTDVGVWFLSFAMLMIGCHGDQQQRFAMEPQDQEANVGSRVTLPCRVENKLGTLQWTKDDFGLGTQRNLSGYDRYSMIGSDEEGDYSLDITNVTLEDDGKYQCQVSSGFTKDSPPIRSRYATLTVNVAPDPPRINRGSFLDATEDQPVDIECVSSGGKPASEIIWMNSHGVVDKKLVKTKIEQMSDGYRFTTRSVFRLTPTKEYHNQTITCSAQNKADREPRTAFIQIEVKYAPKVNISVKSGLEWIPEGSDARIRCDVDANPPPQIYRWYLNDNPVIGDYIEEMIIFNVSRKHNKNEVRCEVSNTVGKNERTLKLDVTYPPSFKTRPKNVEADYDSEVTLRCEADGQPQPEIRWLLDEPGRVGQVKGKSPNLHVRVSNSTAGKYLCKATVEGYPEIVSEATIFIKEPPTILSNKTQIGSEGENARVECAAISVPKPHLIVWYFEGRQIDVIKDPDYAILREDLSDGIFKSSLVIRASQSKHYGVYNCSVTNDYGTANAAITLKPLKTLPLFIILIGVTSGIILFSAFIVLVVICHRRRRNKPKQVCEKPDVTVTTGDLYKESDRSSNISDLKLQFPQSDGSYELDYTSSDRSDTKMPVGLPLAGPVPLPHLRDDPLMQFRYSNDYSDPTYSDPYFKNPGGFVYDYPQGYAPPPHLRVQSPTQLEVPAGNRSLQGSLTRSIDTTSTLPLSTGNVSQNNSLQRTNKSQDETDAINNLGLPVGGETPPTPIYAQPNSKNPGVDLRYSATYGNPYLRNSSLGYGHQVHTAKPASTPAPPPYSAVRSSVVIPSGNGNQPSQATHV